MCVHPPGLVPRVCAVVLLARSIDKFSSYLMDCLASRANATRTSTPPKPGLTPASKAKAGAARTIDAAEYSLNQFGQGPPTSANLQSFDRFGDPQPAQSTESMHSLKVKASRLQKKVAALEVELRGHREQAAVAAAAAAATLLPSHGSGTEKTKRKDSSRIQELIAQLEIAKQALSAEEKVHSLH